jgi:hypothetical protein
MKLRCSNCTSTWKAEAIPNQRVLLSISNSAYGITGIPQKSLEKNGLERINKELKRRTRVVGASQ